MDARVVLRSLGAPMDVVKAAVVRDFVRSMMLPDAIARLYNIGMGFETFTVPIAVPGMKDHPPHVKMVDVEAEARVQVGALGKLLDIGLPRQVGLVDGSDKELPGVFTLGPMQLEEAREIASHGTFMGRQPSGNDAPVSEIMKARADAGEFEIVEVEEGETVVASADQPEPVVTQPPRLEQEILARRRKAVDKRVRRPQNGNGNGHVGPTTQSGR